MIPEQSLDSLLGEAAVASPDERSMLVARVRLESPSVASELEGMLLLLDANSDFLSESVTVDLEDLAADTGPVATDESNTPDLELPIEIGPFMLTDQLGQGGGGSVYLAQQELPKREVAVKLLPLHGSVEYAKRLLEHEANTLARLDHPGIARVYEARLAEQDGRYYAMIALELIEDGISLDKYAQSRELTAQAATELIIDIATSVHHAHQKGVIHRDLKPQNVLVRPDGRVSVIDFGLAGLVEAEGPADRAGAIAGTWRYMSPEHLTGIMNTDTRSDVYAIGLMLYELLAGRPPYAESATSSRDITGAIQNADPAPFGDSRIDRDLEAIVCRTLEKNPVDRLPSAQALREELERWRDRLPVLSRPPTLPRRVALFARRRPLVSVATLTAALTAIGLTLLITGMWIRSERLRVSLSESRSELQERSLAERTVRDDFIRLQERVATALLGERGIHSATDDVASYDLVGAAASGVAEAGSIEAQRRIVEASVSTLDSIRDAASGDSALSRSIARTYLRLGELVETDWWATPEQARVTQAAFEGAVETWEQIVASDPTDTSALLGLSAAASRLSQTLRQGQEDQAAYLEATRAVDASRQAHENTLGSARTARELAWALNVRSDAAINFGPADDGLQDIIDSMEILETAIEEHGSTTGLRYRLSWAAFRRGAWLQLRFGRLSEALNYRRAANEYLVTNIIGTEIHPPSLEDLIRYMRVELDLLTNMGEMEDAAERSLELFGVTEAAMSRITVDNELYTHFADTAERTVQRLARVSRFDEVVDLLDRTIAVAADADPEAMGQLYATVVDLLLEENPIEARRIANAGLKLDLSSRSATRERLEGLLNSLSPASGS